MGYQMRWIRRSSLMAASILVGGLLLAGCDEHVEIIRNGDIPVLKHQTWAWRPAPARKEAKNGRPVVSRDVIGGRETVATETDPANEIVRQELRTAIERQLTGLDASERPGNGGFPGGLSLCDAPPQCECGAHLSLGLSRVGVRPVWMLARMGLRAR